MKRKKVIVLARHKLIYVDTILPVLHELNNNNNNIFTKIIVDDYALGYKKIKENIVINDILSSIGEIILIQGRSDYRTIRWIHALLVLFGIAWDGLRGGILIHFGSANTYPFKLLRLFFQQEKIYLSEAGIVNKVWKKIENRFLDRPQEAHVENKYLDKVICYSEWFYDHSNSRGEESFFYGPSRVT